MKTIVKQLDRGEVHPFCCRISVHTRHRRRDCWCRRTLGVWSSCGSSEWPGLLGLYCRGDTEPSQPLFPLLSCGLAYCGWKDVAWYEKPSGMAHRRMSFCYALWLNVRIAHKYWGKLNHIWCICTQCLCERTPYVSPGSTPCCTACCTPDR